LCSAAVTGKIGRMPDVYFYESFAEEQLELKQFLPPELDCGFTDLTIQETGHKAPPCRFISIRTQTRIPLDWIQSLDAILTRSTGYDHMLAFAASAPRVPALGHLPLYCHRAVAEQAMMMWMALLRRLPQQMSHLENFHRDLLTGRECRGRTLVVVGVGNIGSEVCRVGQALEMRVTGVDLKPRYDGIDFATAEVALPQADIVVCAMDLRDSNRGYFDAARFRMFKPGALFVNVSRGELSPSTALLDAMRSGILGGVGLDVYDHEVELAIALRSGKTSSDPEVQAALALQKMENVVFTPHNAFNTAESLQRKSEHSVRQILAFRTTGRFEWPVPLR
jgi:D-lactate dehydrogenase